MKKLYRSQDDKVFAGVCGGISELYGVDTTILRLAAVFIGLVTGIVPLFITYIAAWIVVPVKKKP